ncbi:hypothetical protein CDL60_03325 [Roseateles noduli]|nr:hypothetical protein CDL60_03325 [Roseateles noduli]
MFKQAKLALAALVVAGAALPAMAAPLFINTGTDFLLQPDGSTRTGNFSALGYTGTLATSVYLGNPAIPGTSVIDTNRQVTMDSFGFPSINGMANPGVPGENFRYPGDPGEKNIDSLNNSGTNQNGFVKGDSFPTYGVGAGADGRGGTWGLTYSYDLFGQTIDTNGDGVSDSVGYTGGVLNLIYQGGPADPNTGKTVLSLKVTGSNSSLNNLFISGIVDYSANGGDVFVQDFFNSGTGLGTLYSNWLQNNISVSWILDTNVNPPVPAPGDLVVTNTGALIRQSTLDGSVVINVPEPGSLALVGLALAGVGFAQRRRALRK